MNETSLESIPRTPLGRVGAGPCTDQRCEGGGFREQLATSSQRPDNSTESSSVEKNTDSLKSNEAASPESRAYESTHVDEERNDATREAAAEDGDVQTARRNPPKTDARDDALLAVASETPAIATASNEEQSKENADVNDMNEEGLNNTDQSVDSKVSEKTAMTPDRAAFIAGGGCVDGGCVPANTSSEASTANDASQKSADATSVTARSATATPDNDAKEIAARKNEASAARGEREHDAPQRIEIAQDKTSTDGEADGKGADKRHAADRGVRDGTHSTAPDGEQPTQLAQRATSGRPAMDSSLTLQDAARESETSNTLDGKESPSDTRSSHAEQNTVRPTTAAGRLTSSPVVDRLLHSANQRADAPSGGSGADVRGHVDPARFVGRVANAFRIAADRDGPLRLRLSPPELGSIRMEVVVKQGAMTASIEAETSSARRALLENLPMLRDRLAEQGVRIERFDVDVQDDGSAGWRNDTSTGQEQRDAPTGDAARRDRHRSSQNMDPIQSPPHAPRMRGDEVFNAVA